MIIHNLLTPFLDSLRRWQKPPKLEEFVEGYFRHVQPWVENSFFVEDARDFHSAIEDLNWDLYRVEALALDPAKEEARLKKNIQGVEALFGFELQGEAILFSALAMMDGYARFDRGTHRVFLGVDESHGRGAYLDILITHELTHVARESRPSVWEGWGINPLMTHDEFGESQPVIEHVFGEGFSCAVSELLVPGEDHWHYAYQTQDTLAQALEHGPAIDRRIKQEIKMPHATSDYTRLYNPAQYGARVPPYAQYVWGWQWAKQLLRERAGMDPAKLVWVCSRELVESAMSFELKELAPAYSI